MAVTTTLEILQSYIGLLIMEYAGKPNAQAFIGTICAQTILPQTSVQTLSFASSPTSGNFILSYNGVNSASIAWNASAATIQTDLQAITGLSSVLVSGSIASLTLTVTFVGVIPPALSLVVFSNTLFNTSSVAITVTETDQTLPLAIQNAFNLISGTALAQGVQLDVLGQYAGVTRTGMGFAGTTSITLDDADFYLLIQMAIIKNQSGSSLATIDEFIFRFFPDTISVTDNANMTMNYIISQAGVSQNLVQLFVTEGLLPAPMGVGINILYPPTLNLFELVDYRSPTVVGSGFQTYQAPKPTSSWLTYQDAVA